jgi:thioredoxin-related protein
MTGKLDVARIDIESDSGQELARKYRISGVPAFVVLDPKGIVVYRQIGGRPDSGEIERRIAALR